MISMTELARSIDHTFLKPFGTPADIERLCREAMAYGFATVAVNPAEVGLCVRLLEGSSVGVTAAAGFPLGQNTSGVKEYEIEDALSRGAREIDMVINIRALQTGDLEYVRREIAALGRACRAAGAVSKIILENCYLTDGQKREACRLAASEGMDFVKTSTGLGTGGATTGDVRLMRAEVGPGMGVKAAGGIRTLDEVFAMIDAGANRIGTSGGAAIMEELRRRGGE